MLIPNRHGSAGSGYRYGYQGSEKDDEVKGNGNSYTTFFRQHDPRVGRWLSIDPKASTLSWQSSYCAMDNNPVLFSDILGDDIDVEDEKGNSYTYNSEDQSFYNDAGEIYPGGSDFIDGVIAKMDKLNDTETGKSMITRLANNDNIITIKYKQGATEAVHQFTSETKLLAKQTLNWDPNKSQMLALENGVVSRTDSWILFGHEMAHL